MAGEQSAHRGAAMSRTAIPHDDDRPGQMEEQLAEEGVAILFASSDMEEVLAMSDRVLVMHQGRISGALPSHEFSEEAIMQLATGAHEVAR